MFHTTFQVPKTSETRTAPSGSSRERTLGRRLARAAPAGYRDRPTNRRRRGTWATARARQTTTTTTTTRQRNETSAGPRQQPAVAPSIRPKRYTRTHDNNDDDIRPRARGTERHIYTRFVQKSQTRFWCARPRSPPSAITRGRDPRICGTRSLLQYTRAFHYPRNKTSSRISPRVLPRVAFYRYYNMQPYISHAWRIPGCRIGPLDFTRRECP